MQGVVSAEMPALFPIEALKAQAVAARTYQVRKMEEAGSDAVLYDVGQAYADTAAQKEKWGSIMKNTPQEFHRLWRKRQGKSWYMRESQS